MRVPNTTPHGFAAYAGISSGERNRLSRWTGRIVVPDKRLNRAAYLTAPLTMPSSKNGSKTKNRINMGIVESVPAAIN